MPEPGFEANPSSLSETSLTGGLLKLLLRLAKTSLTAANSPTKASGVGRGDGAYPGPTKKKSFPATPSWTMTSESVDYWARQTKDLRAFLFTASRGGQGLCSEFLNLKSTSLADKFISSAFIC